MPALSPGSPRCQCAACGRFFSAVSAFDKHQDIRSGELVCRDPATLGLVQRNGGWWGYPGMPSEALVQRRLGAKAPQEV